MSTYAIGDVQGCFSALKRLVELFDFDPTRDTLWFVGDLVNRGPDSLGVLRWVKSLADGAVAVLGNHDLHLLSLAEGMASPRRNDTCRQVLAAPDRAELLAWLRSRPLLHFQNGFALVHAGLLPQWSIEQAVALASEAERALRGDRFHPLLRALNANDARITKWTDDLAGLERLSVAIMALTRLRICTPSGEMQLSYKGPLAHVPEGFLPWFEVPDRKSGETTIVCGHWAALGLYLQNRVLAIDSGCVWGHRLTAVRLEDRHIFQAPCGHADSLLNQL